MELKVGEGYKQQKGKQKDAEVASTEPKMENKITNKEHMDDHRE